MRLVVASCRIPGPDVASAGGVVSVLRDVLARIGGKWVGWSGDVLERVDAGVPPACTQDGRVSLHRFPLNRTDHAGFYLDFVNGLLWPALHALDASRTAPGLSGLPAYERVNRQFARHVASELAPDDVVWIHDFQLMRVAAELRRLGCRQRIGFFLHVPVPPPEVLRRVGWQEALFPALMACDLVACQTEEDARRLRDCIALSMPPGKARALDMSVIAMPVGIDVEQWKSAAYGPEASVRMASIRRDGPDGRLIAAVDRLDASKGLLKRTEAFTQLLRRREMAPGRVQPPVRLWQVAAPSRMELESNASLLRSLQKRFRALGPCHAELRHETWSRAALAALYRAADVGLVTPLRDGMNLVAKEFVAAQDEDDPGVLVLSRGAGAARQMTDALLVDPQDTTGMVAAMEAALAMPLEERRSRHRRLLDGCRKQDAHAWADAFLGALCR